MFHCEVSLQASEKWKNVLKHKMKARIVTSLTVTAGYDTSISFREELQVIYAPMQYLSFLRLLKLIVTLLTKCCLGWM